jgi:RHS repeat-associated protein
MVRWEVSEPYINVWLYDEPLGYQPGLGPRISFKMAYKQRDYAFRTISSGLFNFGTNWNCSWLSYVIDDGVGSYATNIIAGGGQRVYTPDNATLEWYSNTILQRTTDGSGNLTGFVLSHANGAKEYYGHTNTIDGNKIALLTAKVDPRGHTNLFIYQDTGGRTLLRYVVDAEGRTNSLTYGNVTYPAVVTGVQDPFGRSAALQYDSTGTLTNITDVAGLNSSFAYDSNSWVTNLHTPYGNTVFEYIDNTFGFGSGPIRSVRVIDAAGGTNVYMNTQCVGPYNFVAPDTSPFTNNFDVCGPDYEPCRDSFHWDPRQSVGLPDNLNTITLSDLIKARTRHWLHTTNDYTSGTLDYADGPFGLSQALSIEVEPSPDGVNLGQVTFYDYPDKEQGQCYFMGSSSLPSLVARTLPDSTTWLTCYRRDEWGRPTNVVDTYSTGYGATPLLRTNIYVYSGPNLAVHFGPNGNVEDGYAYDAHNQLTDYTNAVGDVTSYTYDGAGRLTGTHTAAGLTTMNIYPTTGAYTNFVQQVIDLEINRTNSYTWNNDLMATHTDERGLTTTYTYDNLQRITNNSDSRGQITYVNSNLDLVTVIDRMGFTNSFTYDQVRRKTSHTDAQGRTTHFNYCTCGALDSIQDAAGNFTYFYYDNAGRKTNVVYPDLYAVTNVYDSLGELVIVTDSAGISATNWFNNQGLRYTVWNAAGQVSLQQFDIKNRLIYVTDANGVTITNTYDDLNRLLTRSYPDGGIEKFGYSPSGLVSYTNQLNFPTFYDYDAAMRKTKETTANGEVIRYTNNAAGDLLSLTDGKLQTTRWTYDSYGRVTNKIDQVGSEILRYKYDSDNRLTNRWSAAKGDTRYKYDPVGNLTNVDYAFFSDVSFAYDALNRITNMVDSMGTTKYTYTTAGQLLTEDGPFASDTITNTYVNRLRTSLVLQQPTGLWTNAFTYDAAGRLVAVTSPAGSFNYTLAGAGSLTENLLLPNSAYITNTYDNQARLTGTYLKTSSDVITNQHQYAYNVGNQRTQQVSSAEGTVGYAYDAIGQLKVEDSTNAGYDRGYTYDAAWNLAYRTNLFNTAAYAVDGLNELTNLSAFGECHYDENGNLDTQSVGCCATTYYYDGENQLVSAESPDWSREYYYDGKLRLRRQVNYVMEENDMTPVGEIHFIYDGMRVIQERDENNTPIVSYTWGTDLSGSLEGAGGIGGLLARSHGYSAGNWSTNRFYHADGNGNISCLLDSDQSLAASYVYDGFGNTIGTSGTWASQNGYRFSSKRIDAQTGLYYYGYRFYAPYLQRWLNRDPINEIGHRLLRKEPINGSVPYRSEELSLYEFVINNPISMSDPLGLDWMSDFDWCLNTMHFHETCEALGAIAGGGILPRGPIGQFCRRAGAAGLGWCAGVAAGCAYNATLWNTPRGPGNPRQDIPHY